MIQRYHIGKRLSEMVVHNGAVYLAGQVAADGKQDITGQAKTSVGADRFATR